MRAAPIDPALRSRSAVTWNLLAQTRDFPLSHHTLFFSNDRSAEFDDIFEHTPQSSPTGYVRVQDRRDVERDRDEPAHACRR